LPSCIPGGGYRSPIHSPHGGTGAGPIPVAIPTAPLLQGDSVAGTPESADPNSRSGADSLKKGTTNPMYASSNHGTPNGTLPTALPASHYIDANRPQPLVGLVKGQQQKPISSLAAQVTLNRLAETTFTHNPSPEKTASITANNHIVHNSPTIKVPNQNYESIENSTNCPSPSYSPSNKGESAKLLPRCMQLKRTKV